MKITHLLNKQVIVGRMATTTGDKMAFATVTGEMMHIQPTDNSKDPLVDGVYGKTFRFYTDGDVDVQAGDRLRINSTSEEYTVVSGGVSRRTFGSFDYLIIVAEKTL